MKRRTVNGKRFTPNVDPFRVSSQRVQGDHRCARTGLYPGPYSTWPGRAPVCFPWSIVDDAVHEHVLDARRRSSSARRTSRGRASVARSKIVTSAQLPSLMVPRLASRMRVAGQDVILRTASSSVQHVALLHVTRDDPHGVAEAARMRQAGLIRRADGERPRPRRCRCSSTGSGAPSRCPARSSCDRSPSRGRCPAARGPTRRRPDPCPSPARSARWSCCSYFALAGFRALTSTTPSQPPAASMMFHHPGEPGLDLALEARADRRIGEARCAANRRRPRAPSSESSPRAPCRPPCRRTCPRPRRRRAPAPPRRRARTESISMPQPGRCATLRWNTSTGHAGALADRDRFAAPTARPPCPSPRMWLA